jgi:CheY-like chemotaxis protein
VYDEAIIQNFLVEVLEDAGFDALRASNSIEAIRAIEQRPETRVLFTDVNMPGPMQGNELFNHVSQRWPAIGSIISSARWGRVDLHIPDRCVFLPKSYRIGCVSSVMRLMIKDEHVPSFGPAA